MTTTDNEKNIYDVVGVGFGPANLAVAIALEERKNSDLPISAAFIESHAQFSWHPGMMLSGSKMQISFLKDFVTMRNPTSSYTFLNYLKEVGRLNQFINMSSFTPSRREYSYYMSWCANRIEQNSKSTTIKFGQRVQSLEYIENDDCCCSDKDVSGLSGYLRINSYDVISGEYYNVYAKNLLVSTGGMPYIPAIFKGDFGQLFSRVVHSSDYLNQIGVLLQSLTSKNLSCQSSDSDRIKIAVIGSGQSAAEIILDIKNKLDAMESVAKGAEIHLIFRKTNIYPSDDSPFSNEVFDPSMTDFFYALDDEHPSSVISSVIGLGRVAIPRTTPAYRLNARDEVLAEAKRTNYSVVSNRIIDTLYETLYDQSVENSLEACSTNSSARIELFPHRKIELCRELENNKVELTIQHVFHEETKIEEYDAVFLGTGYTRDSWKDIVWHGSLQNVFQHPLRQTSYEEVTEFDRGRADFSSGSDASNLSSVFDEHEIGSSSDATSASSRGVNNVEPSERTSFISSSHNQKNKNITERNYRLKLPKLTAKGNRFMPTIWLQGANEATHGISDSLLSVLAIRSMEIVNGIEKEGWLNRTQNEE